MEVRCQCSQQQAEKQCYCTDVGVLYLTDICEGDEQYFFNILSSSRTIQDTTLLIPFPYTMADAEWWIQHNIKQREETGKTWTYAIRKGLANEEIIGVVGYKDLGLLHSHHTAEIGYWIAQPYWGRSIMPACVKTLVEIVKQDEELNVKILSAEIFEGNSASKRVVEKCGFHFECHLPDHYIKNGEKISADRFTLNIVWVDLRASFPRNGHNNSFFTVIINWSHLRLSSIIAVERFYRRRIFHFMSYISRVCFPHFLPPLLSLHWSHPSKIFQCKSPIACVTEPTKTFSLREGGRWWAIVSCFHSSSTEAGDQILALNSSIEQANWVEERKMGSECSNIWGTMKHSRTGKEVITSVAHKYIIGY